jgi:hypothetical protein
MLLLWAGHLHSPSSTNGGMGDVAIARNFVGSINNDDSLLQIIGEDTGNFPKGRSFAHPWPT